MLSQILAVCAAFSWHVKMSHPSVVLFGEYPYPTEDEEK